MKHLSRSLAPAAVIAVSIVASRRESCRDRADILDIVEAANRDRKLLTGLDGHHPRG